MRRFARIFAHEGNELLHPDYFAKTRKAAGAGAQEFAQKLGIKDTGESFEFLEGAPVSNRRVVLFPPTRGDEIPRSWEFLCIGGPMLETEKAEIWIGEDHHEIGSTPQQ